MKRLFLLVLFGLQIKTCISQDLTNFQRDIMNKGIEGVAEDMRKAYKIDHDPQLNNLGMGNRVYIEVEKKYNETRPNVNVYISKESPHTSNSHSHKTSQKTSPSRKQRNALIEQYNNKVRAHNQQIEEQKRLNEERRQEERLKRKREVKQRLYNEGYAQSWASTAKNYTRKMSELDAMDQNMERIRNNHELDGLPSYSGYVPTSNTPQKRSKDGIFPKRSKEVSYNSISPHIIIITQISDVSPDDFLINIPERKVYKAKEIKPKITWDWVKTHPEDTWKWVKEKVYNVDDFLDYQKATSTGNDNLFTNTIRKKYTGIKMEWYNYDLNEKISSSYSSVRKICKDIIDNPDVVREEIKNKTLEYAKDNMTTPVPIISRIINEKTILQIPTIEKKHLDNAKDLIDMGENLAKVLDKKFAQDAVNAVYNGDVSFLQVAEQKNKEITRIVTKATGSVLGRELGTDYYKTIIEPIEISKNAHKKSEEEVEEKSKGRVYFSNTFLPQAKKVGTRKIKKSVIDELKLEMEKELISNKE